MQSAAYYLNESHPKGEKQCSYHGIGESSRERDFTEREKQKQHFHEDVNTAGWVSQDTLEPPILN